MDVLNSGGLQQIFNIILHLQKKYIAEKPIGHVSDFQEKQLSSYGNRMEISGLHNYGKR